MRVHLMRAQEPFACELEQPDGDRASVMIEELVRGVSPSAYDGQ